ncbi:MAG: hypothetical protein K2X82_13960 [Gemmataceae bacterium]|nr:hypothetical protein [Gemmataceae bacterium]
MALLELVVAAVAVTLAFGLIVRARGGSRVTADALVMTYGWDFRVLVGSTVLAYGVLFGVGVAGPGWAGPARLAWVAAVPAGLLAACGAVHLFETFHGRVVVRNEGVSARGLVRTDRLAWDEVESVRCAGPANDLVLVAGRRRLVVPAVFGGRDVFAAVCRLKLGGVVSDRVLARFQAGPFRGVTP